MIGIDEDEIERTRNLAGRILAESLDELHSHLRVLPEPGRDFIAGDPFGPADSQAAGEEGVDRVKMSVRSSRGDKQLRRRTLVDSDFHQPGPSLCEPDKALVFISGDLSLGTMQSQSMQKAVRNALARNRYDVLSSMRMGTATDAGMTIAASAIG